ncbi:thiopeptide-type bacteriocin biosynthesis protein [Streptosporangium sp. NPDC000396]|uniref:thiopeptide-type bacteriocin biosynthesis protein n=1 Tax=Streptosporangium sp. NPDC000396 TaxID=3366185 RepID=UPI0036BDDFE1
MTDTILAALATAYDHGPGKSVWAPVYGPRPARPPAADGVELRRLADTGPFGAALARALVAALGPRRWEPWNPGNDHRAYPSPRSTGLTDVTVRLGGHRWTIDPVRARLDGTDRLPPRVTSASIELHVSPDRLPEGYGSLRAAIALLEAGHVSAALAEASRAAGLTPLATPLITQANATGLSGPVAELTVRPGGRLSSGGSARWPWRRVSAARSAGLAPRGLSADPRPLPEDTLHRLVRDGLTPPAGSLAGSPAGALATPPAGCLAGPAGALGLHHRLAVRGITGVTDGLYELRDGRPVLYQAGPATRRLQDAFRYGPDQVDVTGMNVVWVITADLAAAVREHGPAAYPRALLTAGATAQHVCSAAAAAGLLPAGTQLRRTPHRGRRPHRPRPGRAVHAAHRPAPRAGLLLRPDRPGGPAMAVTPVAPATTWGSLYCFLHWRPEHVDAFLTGTLAPLMDGLREAGRIADWFFIHYAEQGPHLRIRARDADPATVEELQQRLGEAVRAAPYPVQPWADASTTTWRGHGEVCEVAYEPETERYGGAAALPVAEEVFCESSRIAVAVIAATPRHEHRLTAAIDFVLATAIALDLDMLDTIRWLRFGSISWRWHPDSTTLSPSMIQGPALDAAAAQSATVVRRWHDIHASAASGARLRDRWAACVRAARTRLEADDTVDRGRWLQVWASQLHMLLNRLGVLPDEERCLDWFIAAALRAPDGTTDYFADDTGALDRRYLEASSFAVSRITWQQPRDVPPAKRRARYLPAGPAVALPTGGPIDMPLGSALARRTTGRGDLGGPVTAADLGTMLWTAYASLPQDGDPTGHPRRPYPSAGAQYVARLRLIVRNIEGLAPGQYDLDQETRTLLPLGAAPSDDELVTASMWFTRDSSPKDRTQAYDPVQVSTLPALLGLYVDLGALRARYGLRALRFALLEAGHLAQNLALTAAATGLSTGMMGGFYDDVAHELFLLDGIDEVLAYLLPLGRGLSE